MNEAPAVVCRSSLNYIMPEVTPSNPSSLPRVRHPQYFSARSAATEQSAAVGDCIYDNAIAKNGQKTYIRKVLAMGRGAA